MKVSFRKVRLFRINAIKYLKENREETKLKYALEKVLKRTEIIEAKWQSFVSDTELDNAAVNEAGIVQFKTSENGNREYQYTKEGLKQRDKTINEKFDEADSNEIEPYQLSELPDKIEQEWLDVFSPFIEIIKK